MDTIEITKKLMRYKTMQKNPDEIARCADFIEELVKETGNKPERIEHDGVISIRCIPKDAVVLLMSHIDVVDADDGLFEPVEKDGNIYGRGSLDDKYAVAISLKLMEEFPEKVGILITGDEEVGGKNGAAKALEGVSPIFAIALDGGDTKKIITKSKGVSRAKVSFTGKSGHGSRPWSGINAIEGLMEDLEVIKGFFNDKDEGHWHKTLNIGRINGGDSFNKIPDHAEALLDIRYTENDDIENVLEEIRGKIKGELEVKTIEPMFYGTSEGFTRDLVELSGAELAVAHGASDARFLSKHGMEGIIWGADGDGSFHQDDEHVSIESIEKIENILRKFLERR
ncbi:MAG: M20 family metallopeptidase [Candidatus Woesearchaeota archaeon]